MKKALITGITGQDGAYLTKLLLEKGYEVHGLRRRVSSFNTLRIDEFLNNKKFKNKLFLYYSDMSDGMSINNIIQKIQPDEIYNLAAMSHVHISFDIPEYVGDTDGLGTLRILEAVKNNNLISTTKIYQASTSELYGKVQEIPQNEKTPFYPRSPYGVAKLYAYWITVNYRESYKMFASNGILFNHESPMRGETFVTRKISRSVSNIALGNEDTLFLGNLDARRDWGHAKDYVEGMWLILQQNEPSDYVLATGVTTSVRDFVKKAFLVLGIEISFSGKNQNEIGKIIKCHGDVKLEVGKVVVKVNKKYYRPSEVDLLIGDPSRANIELGWKPKYTLDELVKEMVESDYNKLIKK